jgi:predicted PurR-regulated permease PerM
MAGVHSRGGLRGGALWADALGRASVRAGQMIVLLAAAAIVVYAIIRLQLLVTPLMIALILAAALHPVVRCLQRHGVHGSLATWVTFPAAVLVLGGVVTGIVLAVRSEWDELVTAGVAGLERLRVPLALPPAVLIFLGGFVPIVGAALIGVPAALVALVANGPVVALVVIAVVMAVNQLDGRVLQPIVMGKALSLHPLVVLLALAGGGILAGIVGAVLAVPLTAVGWAVLLIWYERPAEPALPAPGDVLPQRVAPPDPAAHRPGVTNG